MIAVKRMDYWKIFFHLLTLMLLTSEDTSSFAMLTIWLYCARVGEVPIERRRA